MRKCQSQPDTGERGETGAGSVDKTQILNQFADCLPPGPAAHIPQAVTSTRADNSSFLIC